MSTTTPLTDSINALTTYANTVTGESDTNLSDAVATLAAGYGGGGGGLTTIASGTFVGNNNADGSGCKVIDIGKKMAQTDFWVKIKAQNGSEYNMDDGYGAYKWVWLVAVCYSDFGYFNLSTSGEKTFTASAYSVDKKTGGTTTSLQAGTLVCNARTVSNTNVSFNTFKITRNSDGSFSLKIGHSNASYPFSPVNFDWEVVYFGSNPSTDIIDNS